MDFKTSYGFTLKHLDSINAISYDGEDIIAKSAGYIQEVPATEDDYRNLMRILTGL